VSNLIYLIPIALLLGGIGLAAFLWSLRSGQYDDLDGAAMRILLDDPDDDPRATAGEPAEGGFLSTPSDHPPKNLMRSSRHDAPRPDRSET
jgi:cbb3-type cytochrome oxidase maturation protein